MLAEDFTEFGNLSCFRSTRTVSVRAGGQVAVGRRSRGRSARGWTGARPDGGLEEMSAHVALLRMQRDGLSLLNRGYSRHGLCGLFGSGGGHGFSH